MCKQKSFTNNDFAYMLNQYNYSISAGDIVAGNIFHKEKQGFLVDIGEEIAGYLPFEETSLRTTTDANLNYLIHATREFFILAYQQKSKQLLLSIKRLEYIRAWKRIKQIETEDIILTLQSQGFNKGGIITVLEGLQGFIPNSHLINKSCITHQNIKCKLLLADEKANKLILSHKKAILDISTNKFKIGDLVMGKIIKIKPYGIFIDIYGIPGLLHISEIGSKNIINITTMFHIGDSIKVKILHIDMEQGRLSVSRKY